MSKKETTTKDLHQQITDTIISQLEQGTVPWHQPWVNHGSASALSIPRNQTTGKAYRGINIPLLWIGAHQNNFQSSQWATFKQWSENGETICKGSKGTMIVFYSTLEKENDKGEIDKIPFLKASFVFNKCQLISYDPEAEKPPELPPQSLVEMQEQADEFIRNTKIPIEFKNDQACYVPGLDKIYMPSPERFIDVNQRTATEAFYSVMFHEVIHATGHRSRLDRELITDHRSTEYAKEELIAELGAAFLCSELDICKQPKEEHASYIASWLTLLKNNKYAITKAASAASKAVDFLQDLQPKLQLA